MDEDTRDNPGRLLSSLIKDLKSLALSNVEYFKNGNQSHHAKFHTSFCLLYEYLDIGIEPSITGLLPRLSEFDAAPELKGNGYRSLLRIIYKCCLRLVQLLRYIIVNRDSILFRRAHYSKELEAYVSTLGQLRACLYYANKMIVYCDEGNLFVVEETLNENVAEQLMSDVEMLNQDCFYGRCLGFQFCESMQRPLNVVAIAMASFSEGYQENSHMMQLATALVSSGKYWMNPELRAQQVVYTTRTANVKFCKAFWNITESDIMQSLPSLVCPQLAVNEIISLGPDSFEVPNEDGSDTVLITPPCSHSGPGQVKVRLMSTVLREGQECHLKTKPKSKNNQAAEPKSPGLIIHCHGGGFVAQSSKSHEVYLRHWAKELNVPILSVDYSLAPESPFPRALEECFYAYAWATQNYEKLGSTGERICLAGDSAGGNLIISMAMRVSEFGIRRPDGIMAAYAPVLVRYSPSPSRLLCLMDPLLPVGILSRCLAAYAGVSDALSSGLASSVFPGDSESQASLKLQSDEATDTDWVIISQEERDAQIRANRASRPSPMDQLTPSPCDDGAKLIVQDQYLEVGESSGIVMESSSTTFYTPTEETLTDPEMESCECRSLEDIRLDSPTPDSDGKRISEELARILAEEAENTENGDRGSDTSSGYEILFDKPNLHSHHSNAGPSNHVQHNDTLSLNHSQVQKGDKSSTKGGDNSPKQNNDSGPADRRMNSTASIDSGCPTDEPSASSPKDDTAAKDRKGVHTNHVPSTSHTGNHAQSPGRSQLQLDLKKSSSRSSGKSTRSQSHIHRSASASVFKTTLNHSGSMSPTDFLRHRHDAQSPLQAIRHLPIVKNPYVSPLLAPDHMLRDLPKICLVACHLDPILDDSVMFTKRLRGLGVPVDLHFVDDLPHGFLNFTLVCKEAKQASEICIGKLRDMLTPDNKRQPET